MHNLSMINFPSASTPSRARKFVWPLRAPKVEPSRSVSSSQLTDIFQTPPPNPPRALPVYDVIHIPWSWDFYFDICE